MDTSQNRVPNWIHAFENTPGGALLVDNKGTILYSNLAARQYFGANSLSTNRLDKLFKEDLAYLSFQDADEEQVFTYECPEGTKQPVSVRSAPLEQGLRLLFIDPSTIENMSVKIAEILARATEALSSSLEPESIKQKIASLPVPQLADWSALFSVDPEGGLTYFSSFHKDKKVRSAFENFLVTNQEAVCEEFRLFEAIQRGESRTILISGDSLEGFKTKASVLCLPIQEENEINEVLCLGIDHPRRLTDTDRVIAEELGLRIGRAIRNARLYCRAVENEQKLLKAKLLADKSNSAKTTFLAAMSHEIRTPLTAILGFSELLQSHGSQTEEMKDFAQRIRDNGDHLLRLIDDILNVSKIESGKVELEIREISLSDLLVNIEGQYSQQALSKKIDLNFTFSNQVPNCFSTDPTRLRQIISNLIGNAIKFTKHGSVTVETSYESQSQFLRMIVSDTGLGLLPEQAAKLFSHFIQADPSHTRQFGGSGLGLVLSRELARLLGGDVELIYTEPGKGSRFQLLIPISPSAESTFITEIPVGLSQTANESKVSAEECLDLCVLLVDDSTDNRLLVGHVLKKAGAKVICASSGQEALLKAFENDYSVVLMDIQMPDMDGIQVTSELRSRGFTKPIIALTACALANEKEQILKQGFSDYLAKPINQKLLISTIKKWSDSSKSQND